MPRVAQLLPETTEIVNAHDWLALRAGRVAARNLSVPFVWTRNDDSRWERAVVPEHAMVSEPRLSRRLLRAAAGWPDLLDARRAAAIVVLSELQVEMVRRSYRKDATVVPIGPAGHFFDAPDRTAARRRLGVPEDCFLVVGAGVFLRHRRFEDLLEALSMLSDHPEVRALIAGSDHMDSAYADGLTRLAVELGVADRVVLKRDSMSEDEMVDVYAAGDLFLLLSTRYAWGIAPLEALAVGTPVVVSSGAGVSDVLAGRPGVAILPPEAPAALATIIKSNLGGELSEGIETTRAWLRDDLSSDSYAARMEEVFSAALMNSR
jgi:glycosyltransferase involved in cell wall biosynthesis